MLSGLDNTGASSRTGNPGSHAKPAGAFLTGVEPLQTTSNSSLELGVSMDQIAARTIGQDTPLPSLELGLEGADTVNGVGTCGVGFSCAYQNSLAWTSPSTPLPVEANPRVVFERLFGSIDSTDPAVRSARLRRQSSIIDSVLDKVHRLHGDLGRRDQRKLGEYVDSVREIERRIQNAETNGRELPLVDSPAGIPVSYDEHARLMFDMQALAFQTDTTRVITFQIGREQSGATYPQIGVSDSHHPILAPRRRPEQDRQPAAHQHLPRLAARLLPRQAGGHCRWRRLGARQRRHPVRQRHQRRQPARFAEPAAAARGRGRAAASGAAATCGMRRARSG